MNYIKGSISAFKAKISAKILNEGSASLLSSQNNVSTCRNNSNFRCLCVYLHPRAVALVCLTKTNAHCRHQWSPTQSGESGKFAVKS